MKQKIYEQPTQIQLELPDYSYEYEQWLKKKEQQNIQKDESVIIIDIY
jgi:hypothetical protein